MDDILSNERRQQPRSATDVDCLIWWDGKCEAATIKNISIYGAQLSGSCFPPIGTPMTLVAEGLELCARVIWLGREKCGVLLEQRVDPVTFIRTHAIRPMTSRSAPPVTITRIMPDRYA